MKTATRSVRNSTVTVRHLVDEALEFILSARTMLAGLTEAAVFEFLPRAARESWTLVSTAVEHLDEAIAILGGAEED